MQNRSPVKKIPKATPSQIRYLLSLGYIGKKPACELDIRQASTEIEKRIKNKKPWTFSRVNKRRARAR